MLYFVFAKLEMIIFTSNYLSRKEKELKNIKRVVLFFC